MLAAIYARYSSDRQRDTSLTDQEAVCRRRAEAEHLTVVRVYADAAISGTRADRPQYRQLLADAEAGHWQAVLVEDLSRLSRDEVEGVQAVRRLEHRGIRVVGVADGYDSARPGRTAQRGVRALLSALYLEDLAARTHRGLEGQARRGHATGGRPYGYRSHATADGALLQIDPEQAAIVQRIYRAYAAGHRPRRIAADLNADGIPGPRGGTWAFSALYGHPAKHTGILRNPTYIGRPRWNASKWEHDPDTGARVRRERPPADWITTEQPHLQIIDRPLWDAVQARLHANTQPHQRSAGPAPRRLLSGLLVCGHCGGAIAVVNRDRYGCTWARHRGPAVCDQRRTVQVQVAERRILAAIAGDLYSPAALAEYRAALLDELKRASAAAAPDLAALQRTRRELAERIDHLVAEIASGTRSRALSAALEAAEADLERTEQDLRAAERPPIPLLTDIEGTLRRQTDDLGAALEAGDRDEARAILAAMLGEVRVYARGGHLEAVLPGIPGQYAIDGSGGAMLALAYTAPGVVVRLA